MPEASSEMMVDNIYMTQDYIYAVISKVKLFKLSCSTIREENKFSYN